MNFPADYQTMGNMALLREAAVANPQVINSRLADAGFGDISRDELLVLGVIALTGGLAGGHARGLGISAPAASRMAETLTRHGYLAAEDGQAGPAGQDGQDRPGGPLTRRAQALLPAARRAIRSARWADFEFRPGDIVISTLPKSGTTWVQMICALLIFQTAALPAPLPELSPWMESGTRDEVYGQLAGQRHRRFIKTHLPMRDIPVRPGVSYLVIARHPLDVATSMYYQDGPFPFPPREWLLQWTGAGEQQPHRDSLDDAMGWLSYVWANRGPHLVLLHYRDLSDDLAGEMRRISARLDIAVPDSAWPRLVQGATFEQMRAVAPRLVDRGAGSEGFFRSGTSGSGRELLTDAELARYHARVAGLAPADLLAWLHRDD